MSDGVQLRGREQPRLEYLKSLLVLLEVDCGFRFYRGRSQLALIKDSLYGFENLFIGCAPFAAYSYN